MNNFRAKQRDVIVKAFHVHRSQSYRSLILEVALSIVGEKRKKRNSLNLLLQNATGARASLSISLSEHVSIKKNREKEGESIPVIYKNKWCLKKGEALFFVPFALFFPFFFPGPAGLIPASQPWVNSLEAS